MVKAIRLALVVLALALVSGWSGAAQAAPQAIRGQDTFRLEAGGKATIIFESFCIDYGLKFPTAVGLPPTQVAQANVAGALNYALSKDYTTSAPKEVQFALWQARGAQGSPAVGAQGTEIGQNTTTLATPPAGATSLLDALRDNRVKATAGSWNGIGEQVSIGSLTTYFQGRGQLQIENSSGQALTLYMPIGTVFPAPAAEFQNMVGYATDIQVTNPTLPTTGFADTSWGLLALILPIGLLVIAMGYVTTRRAVAS